MKKRIFKSVFVIAMLLCITLVLFACSSVDIEMTDQNPEEGSGDSTITITFVDGNEVIHSTTDLENALSYLPEDKEGYSFVGWYLDSELSQPVGEMLTQSISLYAKWNVKTFSVRFINHDGSIIPVNGLPVQTVEYGNSAIAPEDPVYAGHEFIGWSIDFSSVKSDLAIRANFGTAKQSIILYGEDGALLSSEKVEVGSDITFKYNTLLEYASQSLPGGLALDTLCIDEELSIPYQVPSGEHLMPTTDLVLYVRPTIVDIEGLKITPSRSTFRYDLQGFSLQGSLSENLIIDYSFEWVDVTNGWEIENNTQSAIEIGCKDVGEYVYELRATASYKNLEPKVSTVRTTIVVNPGTLEGLISVDGFEGVYNGLERDLIFTGLLDGDVVTYRRVGEENYANNPIKNAGDYNVETMVVRKNYEPLELPSVTVKLEKAELKLEVSLSETEGFVDGKYLLTYGSKIPKINYNIVGFVNGETENVLQGGKIENNPYYVGAEVNEYELGIQEDCWTSNNYKFTEWQTVILKVKKRALIVNAENKSVTYGDLKPQYTANLEGALELDVDNILGALKFTCSYKQRDDVGNYDIVVEYANDSYDVTLNKATLKVNPKSITLSPIDAKVTYGDPIPTYKFKAEGLLSGHSVDTLGNVQAICNYAYKSNAGSYTISVNTASVTNKNYRANYNTAKLTVSAKPVTLSLGSTEITYYDAYPNSEHFKALLSAEGLVEGDTIEKDLETINAHFTSAYAIGQPVGEYEIIINGYSSINYTISFHSGVMKVNKANMTIGVKSAEIVYGNFFAPELVYTGLFGDEKDEPELAFQTIGSISGYVEGCGVGSYILSASGYEASNYNVSYANGELNIIKREVTVVVDKKEITYGDAEPIYTYNLKSYMEGKEVFAEGESLATLGTLSIIAEGYVGNAGGYDVIASGLSNENYTVIYQNSTLSVKVKDVTVSPVSINLVYGDAVPTYTFVVDGLVAGDELGDLGTPIAICAYEYKSNVGSYPITLQAGVLQNSNYNVSLGQATLSVARKTATLTLTNKNIIYYDAYPNNNEFASLLVAEGLVDGDSINQTLLTANASFTSDYRVGSNVGEYEVVVSGYESINYDLTVTNGYLIVGKKALTIGVEGDSLVYGETYEVVFTYDGLVGEEKNNPSLAISNLVLSGYTAGQGADTYTLSGAGAESTNYEISYTEGTLVISPRAVTLTINPQTITYGDDDPEFTYYFTAYKDGESVFAYDEDASALGTLKIVADGYVGNADKYDLIATGISSTQNYTLTVNTSTYVVNRKALTVSAKSYTITFGDAKPVFESDVDGLVKGETIASLGTQILYNCLFVEDRTAIAGVYDVEPLLSLGNYKISTTKGTLTVNKKAMTLSAKNFNVTFGDNTPELVAVPSVLAYNDTVDTIGSYELTTSYVRGNSVGSYAINLTASSQKYELSIVNGTIKVGQKSVEVTWSGNDATYVYNDTDRSSLIGATYVDIYGETIEATVSFKASNSTPNRFHNAGNYTTTASTSDGNYKLTSATITLKMDKATYDESTIVYDGGTFSGVYSPDKTLGVDYLFENNEDGIYRWKVEGTVPVVKTTTYIACYNADRENYYDVEISVSVTLSPATVTLSSEIFAVDEIYEIESEIDVNSTNLNPSYTISPTIWWWEDGIAKRAIGASGNYTIVYSNNNVFTPGSYYTVMAFMSDNYILNTEDGEQFVGYFLKYKSVDVGGTLYTPEDALYVASSGNVIVKSNTSFAMQAEVISYYYNDVAYYTVKSGVTLLLPYNATDTTGFIEEGEDGSENYTAHPEGEGGAALYLTLTVPSIVNLNVSGTLTVGAVTGKRGTGTKQNDVTGNYAEINLNGNVTASNAVINVYGYIKGAGQVTATGSTQITENMYLEGWVGGTISSVRFMGTTSLRSTQLMSSGTLSVSNPNMFPFSQYQLRAIQSKLELQYGSSLRGVIKIGTSKQSAFGMDVVKAKISKAYFNIISSSTVADSGIIRMTTETDKVTKTYADGRVKITTDGQIIDGYTSLSVLVLAKTVAMTTEKVLFAINGTIDIVVNSGSFTQTYKYKLMPGATITVKSGATYNMNGTIVTYKEGFSDISQYPYPAGRGDAKVIVEGTMNVNGSLGGSVYGVNGGKVVIGSNATITSVKSIEGTGSMATGSGFIGKLTMYFTFTESGSVVRNLDLFNASGSTTSASKGTTYTYNGTAWA